MFEPVKTDLDLNVESGLHRFSTWSSAGKLNPKIPVRGAIPFELPDEEAEYSIQVRDGKIKAIGDA